MEAKEITTAIETNPELLKELVPDLMPKILETDKGKEIITNRAESIYQEKITGEVSKIHSQYDSDMETILGEKPSTLEDGTKEKTYDKIKGLYTELKTLREQKESLSKDNAIKALNDQIEELKKNGGGSHWEKTFNTEKEKWTTERNSLNERLKNAETQQTVFQKKTDIESALRGFKWREDVPESARKALINVAVDQMVKQSKIENGRVIYLDDNGAQINDVEYKAESAKGVLMRSLKDIIHNENRGGGGGAPTILNGSLEKSTIDGIEVQKLILNDKLFSTKTEFLKVAEKALLESGIGRHDSEWDQIKNDAYKRYNVEKMPR